MTGTDSRSAAQLRADAIRVFQEELDRLGREGALTLTAEQRTALAAHHRALLAGYGAAFDIDRDAGAKQLSMGMRIASLLGALALSASVFFLFYQFWGNLGTNAQVTILVGAAMASFAATLWIHARDSSGYFTNLAAMVAFVCFVVNLSMIGQIFNVTPTDNALVAWAALAFLLAYTCDLKLLLVAGIFCMLGFISARAATWGGGTVWSHFWERPENFFIPALAMFAVPPTINHDRHPEFPSIYRQLSLLALFIPILILSHSGDSSYLSLNPGTTEAAYQWISFIVSAAVAWLGVRKGWIECVNTGVLFFIVSLYIKLFDWWWETMPKYLFFLVLGLIALLILVVLRRVRRAGLPVLSGAST